MYERLAQQLEEWETRAALPQSWLFMWRRILGVQEEISSRLPPAALSLEPAASTPRLVSGRPLLTFRDLRLDWTLLRWAMAEAARAVTAEVGEDVAIRVQYLARRGDSLWRAARAWYHLSSSLSRIADRANLPEAGLALILSITLQPVLRVHAQLAAPLVRQELWRMGQCPVCGGAPDLAHLAEETRARWLVCSRCEAEWLFRRLGCPYCGNQRQNTLAYYISKASGHRLYVCDRCRCYLKCLNPGVLPSQSSPALERIASYGLDIQARQMGYRPLGCAPALTDRAGEVLRQAVV